MRAGCRWIWSRLQNPGLAMVKQGYDKQGSAGQSNFHSASTNHRRRRHQQTLARSRRRAFCRLRQSTQYHEHPLPPLYFSTITAPTRHHLQRRGGRPEVCSGVGYLIGASIRHLWMRRGHALAIGEASLHRTSQHPTPSSISNRTPVPFQTSMTASFHAPTNRRRVI